MGGARVYDIHKSLEDVFTFCFVLLMVYALSRNSKAINGGSRGPCNCAGSYKCAVSIVRVFVCTFCDLATFRDLYG